MLTIMFRCTEVSFDYDDDGRQVAQRARLKSVVSGPYMLDVALTDPAEFGFGWYTPDREYRVGIEARRDKEPDGKPYVVESQAENAAPVGTMCPHGIDHGGQRHGCDGCCLPGRARRS